MLRADAPVAAPAAKIFFTLEGIRFAARDMIVTKNEGFTHILIDLFPYRDEVKPDHDSYLSLAKAAAKEVQRRQAPRVKFFKVDLVEFKDRDEYDAPIWSSVKIVFRQEFHLGKLDGTRSHRDTAAQP
jgi:hypothetical protein